jgi:hypothetical protein
MRQNHPQLLQYYHCMVFGQKYQTEDLPQKLPYFAIASYLATPSSAAAENIPAENSDQKTHHPIRG